MGNSPQQVIDVRADKAPSGQPWAYGVRTCAPGGRAYNGFVGQNGIGPDTLYKLSGGVPVKVEEAV